MTFQEVRNWEPSYGSGGKPWHMDTRPFISLKALKGSVTKVGVGGEGAPQNLPWHRPRCVLTGVVFTM